jgi:hypothetical protein
MGRASGCTGSRRSSRNSVEFLIAGARPAKIYVNSEFSSALCTKTPQLRHHAVTGTVPYALHRARCGCDFCKAPQSHRKSRGDIVSNFRIICVAVLTAPVLFLLAVAAHAQNAPADASGKSYLAGLRPPHESHKAIAKTSRGVEATTKTTKKTAHKPTAKTTRTAAKRPPSIATSPSAHARARTATKLTSRLEWPQVDPAADPAAAEDRRMPETALQFTADDASPNAAATSPRVTAAAKAPTPKTVTEERNSVAPAAPIDQLAAGDQVPATSKVVQIERFQASAPDTARVEAPPQTQTLAAASIVEDRQTKPDDKRAFGSSIAPTLAMLAGAISAALVGCWLFGFGSARGIKLGA